MTALAEGRADGRLPLTVVGGFLGAGKSTWLRHQLHQGRFARAAIIVNEAAETPVDHLLLARAHRLHILAAGCACCDGRTAFVALLRAVCDEAPSAGLDGIVLETSGLADPAAIAAAVAADPVLVRRLAIARTVTLVDGLNGVEQLAAEPLARAQAEAADALVVTKAGGLAAETLARLVATLAALNPAAGLAASERGELVPLPGLTAPPFPLPAPPGARPPIRPHRLAIGDGAGWPALSPWLSALLFARGDTIVRVKGVVATAAGRLLIQSVRHLVQPPEILPPENRSSDKASSGQPPEVGTLVLIGRGLDDGTLARSWHLYGQ